MMDDSEMNLVHVVTQRCKTLPPTVPLFSVIRRLGREAEKLSTGFQMLSSEKQITSIQAPGGKVT